ncbi:MAG: hypothetical protein CME60_07535 [Halobacteriovoraceae bacterium]|nr:hypothetical protein [Halobacteriovoraceae bacterium]
MDRFFNYRFGELEYRSLNFEEETLATEKFQNCALTNYTDPESPFTRIIEHKHFEFTQAPQTVITREFPKMWQKGLEPYYPVNDSKNQERFKKYHDLSQKESHVIFGGRLAEYRYYDMHQVIASALSIVNADIL